MIKVYIQKYDDPKWVGGFHVVHDFKELKELAMNYPENMFEIKYKLEGKKHDCPSKIYQDSGYVGFVVKGKTTKGYTFYEYFSSYEKAEDCAKSIAKSNKKLIVLKYVTKAYHKTIMVIKNDQINIIWEPVSWYTSTSYFKKLDIGEWYSIEEIVNTFSDFGIVPTTKGCIQLGNLGIFTNVNKGVHISGKLIGYYTYMPF